MAANGASKLEAWIKTLLAVMTVVAAVTYGVLRLAYFRFYQHLGTTPEDVGIDRTLLLTQAVIGPALFVLWLGVAGFVLGLVLAAFLNGGDTIRLARAALGRASDETRRARAQLKETVKEGLGIAVGTGFGIALVGLIGGAIVTLSAITATASERGEEVAEEAVAVNIITGEGVGTWFGFEFGDYPSIPLLEIQAVPATVTWKDADRTDEGAYFSQCLLYLGDNGDFSVFYGTNTRQIVRVSTADIVLTLDGKAERLPADPCKP